MNTYPLHYWPILEESSRRFVCDADQGIRTNLDVSCGWCLAWMRSGPRQRALLDKAAKGILMTNGNAERMAARRLVRRGVLTRFRLGGNGFGFTTFYRVNR